MPKNKSDMKRNKKKNVVFNTATFGFCEGCGSQDRLIKYDGEWICTMCYEYGEEHGERGKEKDMKKVSDSTF